MGRFLAGVAAAMLVMSGAVLWWKGAGRAADPIPLAPATAVAGHEPPLADPPAASEQTREEKRFSRYDKDRDGTVARAEYLAGRQKAFAKLDLDHDGRLSFDEYAAKAIAKFAAADTDHSAALTPAEFVATRVARGTRPRAPCPPAAVKVADDD